jgi:hypothetical protein
LFDFNENVIARFPEVNYNTLNDAPCLNYICLLLNFLSKPF